MKPIEKTTFPTEPTKQAQRTRYPGQLPEEKTIRVIYKSIFAVVPFLFVSVVLFFVGLLGVYYGARYGPINNLIPSISLNLTLISPVFLVFVGLFTLAVLFIWRRNQIVVTNEHIVDIDQLGLFQRNVATLTLTRIQDVSAVVHGPFQTLFQYGTVIIQTAGERENFNFDYVPNPYEVEQYILQVHHKYVHGDGGESQDDGVAED